MFERIKEARRELRDARDELVRVAEDDRAAARRAGHWRPVESDAFLDANSRVIAAERALPWWLRWC